MRTVNTSGVTPQRKIIGTNERFGNTGIKNQQGSTVVLYDTLEIDGRTEFRFFEGSGQRNFPLSNTGSQGNQLPVGSTMVVERAYLTFLIYSQDNTLNAIESLDISPTNYPAAINLSEFSFAVANTDVIKTLPILSFVPEFNKSSENNLSTSFDFDTQVVIPPLMEFVASLRSPKYTTPGGTNKVFIRLTIEGAGAIIAPRATF